MGMKLSMLPKICKVLRNTRYAVPMAVFFLVILFTNVSLTVYYRLIAAEVLIAVMAPNTQAPSRIYGATPTSLSLYFKYISRNITQLKEQVAYVLSCSPIEVNTIAVQYFIENGVNATPMAVVIVNGEPTSVQLALTQADLVVEVGYQEISSIIDWTNTLATPWQIDARTLIQQITKLALSRGFKARAS